jgi:penicillin-binding protein 1C
VRRRTWRAARGFRLAVLSIVLVLVTSFVFLIPSEAPSVPSFSDVRASYRPSDAVLLDRHGRVVHELRVDHSRRRLEWAALDAISPALRAAVVASEDRRFAHHGGVDLLALAGSGLRRLGGQGLRGASTISMQLASLLEPSLRRRGGPRTADQKWLQMRWAWALERSWSKAEILEAYLNLVTFRAELQGAAAAARVLFDKAPHGLTEAESLVLAALLRAPNAAAAAIGRRARALRRAQKSPADSDLADAIARALQGAAGTGPRVTLAPHVAHRLLRPSAPVESVSSTLDLDVQRVATETLRKHLVALRSRHVRDGAVLVADVASGEVLAYLGGSGDLSGGRHVDAVRARRQAGSTLKPLLYALAFDRRLLTPASLLEDAPLELPVFGGLYRPENYDQEFLGLVSARTALAGSVNIPAVRTLALVGVEEFTQQLRRLGFAGVVESGDFYGPSLALGSADVSLWELVAAYRALANGGFWEPLRLVRARDRVRARPNREDSEANREHQHEHEHRVYSEAAAFLVSDVLADRDSRSVTFGLESPLATRFWTAVKTGTSKSMRDNWCIGYSRRYVAGVWVGNLAGDPMHNVSGMSGAAPVWLDLMAWLHRDQDSLEAPPPAGVTRQQVSFAENVEAPRVELFLSGTEPPAAAEPRLVAGRPRIVAPANGTVIALDPDIPADLQRIAFIARAGAEGARWVLDGSETGPAGDVTLWPPRPGMHRLELIGEGERVLDAIRFVVRGEQRER